MLAHPIVVSALTRSRTAKIEPQGGESFSAVGLPDDSDHEIVHITAVERMGVGDDNPIFFRDVLHETFECDVFRSETYFFFQIT